MNIYGEPELITKHFYVEFEYLENPNYRISDWYCWATRILYIGRHNEWLKIFKTVIKTFYEQHPDLLDEFNMDDLARLKKYWHKFNKEHGPTTDDFMFHVLHEKYCIILMQLKIKKSCSGDGDYVLK
jgi:hypothetical protein